MTYKCNNCGEELIKLKNNYECPFCGKIFDEQEITGEEPSNNVEEKLLDSINSSRGNETNIEINARRVLEKEPNNLLGVLVLDFLARKSKPENFKSSISKWLSSNPERKALDITIRFIVKNSDYKFISIIEDELKEAGLFSDFENVINQAKSNIESNEEIFANKKANIFVCYSSNDLLKARTIVDQIEDDGLTCWYADRNMPKNSPTDFRYKEDIEAAIKNCDIVLVLTSKNCMYSDDVKWELDLANKYSKKRVEYVIEGVKHTTKFKEFFDGIQWIDASKESQIPVLLQRLNLVMTGRDAELYESDNSDNSAEQHNETNNSIDSLNFSHRTHSCLERADLTMISDLLELNEQELLKVRNLGLNGVEEIKEKLAERGLSLKPLNQEQLGEEPSEEETISEEHDSEGITENYNEHDSDDGIEAEIPQSKKIVSFDEVSNENIKPEHSIDSIDSAYYEQTNKNVGVDAPLLNEIGKKYYIGDGCDKDCERAYKCFLKAAEAGNTKAMCNLARCYERGTGVYQNTNEAFNWYEKAATLGNTYAMFRLASTYLDSTGSHFDSSKGIDLMRKAAEAENADAQYSLGVCYRRGSYVEHSDEKAIYWLDKAIANGSKDALSYKESHYITTNEVGSALELDDEEW